MKLSQSVSSVLSFILLRCCSSHALSNVPNSTVCESNDSHIKVYSHLARLYYYRAFALYVIPKIGTEYLDSNMGYTWQFYIVTERK
jgi:hypothetical protein